MFDEAAAVLREAVAHSAFPCAVAEVGTSGEVLWQASFGHLEPRSGAAEASLSTVFDLASLTKPLAAGTAFMRLVQAGTLSLEDAAARWLTEWRGSDRESVTIEDLLAHLSGLTAHLPLYRDSEGRADFERVMCTLPLECPPRARAIYSDLGFMLLGFIAHDAAGRPLDVQFEEMCRTLRVTDVTFRPPSSWRSRTAPTGLDTWRGRVLVGEVHDRNAWALGGVAGHAGLFGTAPAVGSLARILLGVLRRRPGRLPLVDPEIAERFARRTAVAGSSRALSWDTMLPTSSCGTRMHETAIGHTGYTGTSLWIDPVSDVYVVLLTNRVHPNDANDAILAVRPRFHDAVMIGRP